MLQALIGLLKPLIKLLIFLMLTVALAFVLSFPINLLFYWFFQPLKLLGMPERLLNDLRLTGRLEFMTTPFSFVPAGLIAIWITTRWLERRPFVTLGLTHTGWVKEFGLGVILAVIVMSPILILLAHVAPYFPVTLPPEAWSSNPRTYASTFSEWFAVAIVVGFVIFLGAFFEELIFRGYGFQVVMATTGQWPAVLVTSILFAVVHFQSHAISGMIGAGFIGLLLATVYLQSKSLWVVAGLHTTINWLSTGLLFLGVIDSAENKQENWFFAAATGIMALIMIVITLKYLKSSPTMEALWQQYVPIAQPWAQLRAWWARRKGHAATTADPPPKS